MCLFGAVRPQRVRRPRPGLVQALGARESMQRIRGAMSELQWREGRGGRGESGGGVSVRATGAARGRTVHTRSGELYCEGQGAALWTACAGDRDAMTLCGVVSVATWYNGNGMCVSVWQNLFPRRVFLLAPARRRERFSRTLQKAWGRGEV